MNTISEMMKSGRIASLILVLALCGCAGRSDRHSDQETTERKKVAQESALQGTMSAVLPVDALTQVYMAAIDDLARTEKQEMAKERSTGDYAAGVCVANCSGNTGDSGGVSSSWLGSGSSSGGTAKMSASIDRDREWQRRARERRRLEKKREESLQRRRRSLPKPMPPPSATRTTSGRRNWEGSSSA